MKSVRTGCWSVVLAVGLAACGGSGGSTAATSTTDPAGTTTTQASPGTDTTATFVADVWADNWFSLYANGELVGEDSVPITTQRSFNTEQITFEASYPLTVAIVAKDYVEDASGLEYIGTPQQQIGDGGIVVQVHDAKTGELVAATNADWRTFVTQRAPLDAACAKSTNPIVDCKHEDRATPDGWAGATFDDTAWPKVTVYTEADVQPHGDYGTVTWEPAAKLIWGPDLKLDNVLLLRSPIIDGPAAETQTAAVTNVWKGAPVDSTKLPIGTSHVSTTSAAVGGLLACTAGNPNGAGAFKAGDWIDEVAGTWDATKKVSVQGSVSWPTAKYQETKQGTKRVVLSSGVPLRMITGTFPIAADDPAYSYDRNPNSIAPYTLSMSLPLAPKVASTPSCLPGGIIGVVKNGVALFAPLDEQNRDAVAYETQDACDGHPQQASVYHYHDIPSCILDASTGASTVVGFASDGYPIVVERDADDELPTNADLDECHGRTSPVLLDGERVTTYHYSATHEFPYFIGCFHGTTA